MEAPNTLCVVSVEQICLRHIKGTGRFEHFYQLFLVIFLAALRMSLSFPAYQEPREWQPGTGAPSQRFLCPALCVLVKGKSPIGCAWSRTGLRVESSSHWMQDAKQKGRTLLKYYFSIILVFSELLSRSFWLAERNKKVLTAVLEIDPHTLRLSPDRDCPEDLTAHLVHDIVPHSYSFWAFDPRLFIPLQEITCCAGWLLLHLVRDGSLWFLQDLQDNLAIIWVFPFLAHQIHFWFAPATEGFFCGLLMHFLSSLTMLQVAVTHLPVSSSNIKHILSWDKCKELLQGINSDAADAHVDAVPAPDTFKHDYRQRALCRAIRITRDWRALLCSRTKLISATI